MLRTCCILGGVASFGPNSTQITPCTPTSTGIGRARTSKMPRICCIAEHLKLRQQSSANAALAEHLQSRLRRTAERAKIGRPGARDDAGLWFFYVDWEFRQRHKDGVERHLARNATCVLTTLTPVCAERCGAVPFRQCAALRYSEAPRGAGSYFPTPLSRR